MELEKLLIFQLPHLQDYVGIKWKHTHTHTHTHTHRGKSSIMRPQATRYQREGKLGDEWENLEQMKESDLMIVSQYSKFYMLILD